MHSDKMNPLYLFCSQFPHDWYSLFPPEAGKSDAHISYRTALSLTFMGLYFQAAGREVPFPDFILGAQFQNQKPIVHTVN